MRISVQEAAKRLELPDQSVRSWIKKGTCPFGEIVADKKQANGRNTYYINSARLELYLQGKL